MAGVIADCWCGEDYDDHHVTPQMLAELATLRTEVDRLTACLKRANEGCEKYERLYYLTCDERDKALNAEVDRIHRLCAIANEHATASVVRSRFMAAGWRRLAKERKIPGFVGAILNDAARIVADIRTATIRECAAIADDISRVHAMAFENIDAEECPREHAYYDGAEDGARKCNVGILDLLPEGER